MLWYGFFVVVIGMMLGEGWWGGFGRVVGGQSNLLSSLGWEMGSSSAINIYIYIGFCD